MIDLTKYGFTKIKETDKWDEYEGHGVVINIYNYGYMTFDNKEIMRNTFVVSSKRTMSPAFPIASLNGYLRDRGIIK